MFNVIASAAATVGALAGGYAYAANWPTSQIFGRTLVAGRDPREVALTFDDGPNDACTPQLLEVLSAFGVRASFFLIGRFVEQSPGLAREIQAAGHLIGNHTMTHPVLLFASPARVRDELTLCSRAIEDAIGEPVRYFRPPHGARRPDVLRAARELGLTPVLWNGTGHDWDAGSAVQIESRVLGDVRRSSRRGMGSNILLHDGGQARMGVDRGLTVAATRALLQRWQHTETRCVTADRWQS